MSKGACVPGNVPLTQPLVRESSFSVKGGNDCQRVECSPLHEPCQPPFREQHHGACLLIITPENEKKTKEFIFDKLDGDKGGELIYIGIRG